MHGLRAAAQRAARVRPEDALGETFPGLDWEREATWFWQRVVQHGRRRAEEMREAGTTVGDVDVAPRMAIATAEVQQWIATLRADDVFGSAFADATWRELADRIERQ